MGYTGPKLEKSNPLRDLCKIRELALGYGCGWEKLIVQAKEDYGMDLTKDDPEWIETEDGKISGWGTGSKKIVADYREQNKQITGIWNKLDDMFKRSIDSDFFMRLPSGRRMRYERVRCEFRIEPDKETGKPKRKTVFTCGIGDRRVMTYGGKLTENLVQATAREVFGFHLLSLMDKISPDCVLFSAHDEAITEVDKSITANDVEAIMSECPEWLKGCPIAADAKEVPCYQK